MPTVQLTRRLNEINSRLEGAIVSLVRDVADEIGGRVVLATPVDTGFARGNWRPSVNAPATVPVTQNDPSGAATIGRITTVARSWRPGDTLYLVNNAPYIGNLNNGSSPQAPAGFVQEAVRSGFAAAIARRSGGLL